MFESEQNRYLVLVSRLQNPISATKVAVFGCKKMRARAPEFKNGEPTLPKYGGYDNCMMSISLSGKVTFWIDDLNKDGNVEF